MSPLPRSPAPEYTLVFDALQDPVVASDETGSITYINEAATRLLGCSQAELVGKPLTTIIPPRFRAAHEAGFAAFMRHRQGKIMGRPVRVRCLHKEGHEIDIELTLSNITTPTGHQFIMALVRDLRERVELEHKLASQRRVLAQYAAVGALQGATTPEDAISKLLEATAHTLGWQVALYWAFDPATQRLHLGSTWTARPADASFLAECRALTFASEEGLPGRVLATRQAVWSQDVQIDKRYVRSQLAVEHEIRTALLFPVYCAQRTWGVLEYLSEQEETPDEELLQTMASIGFQAGQFLERVATETKLREALEQVQAEKNNLHSLLMQAPAAIAIVKGPEFRYELSNPINQSLAGDRPLLGKTVREALPGLEADGTIAILNHVYRT